MAHFPSYCRIETALVRLIFLANEIILALSLLLPPSVQCSRAECRETWYAGKREVVHSEACSCVSRRSCGAQAWDCREGALAVRHTAAVLRGALRGALRDILHSSLV